MKNRSVFKTSKIIRETGECTPYLLGTYYQIFKKEGKFEKISIFRRFTEKSNFRRGVTKNQYIGGIAEKGGLG